MLNGPPVPPSALIAFPLRILLSPTVMLNLSRLHRLPCTLGLIKVKELRENLHKTHLVISYSAIIIVTYQYQGNNIKEILGDF